VAAAVSEAGLMADEDLAGAEGVPVRASRRRVGDPLTGRGLHQLTQHNKKHIRPSREQTGLAFCS
jgi:hypothetical protein